MENLYLSRMPKFYNLTILERQKILHAQYISKTNKIKTFIPEHHLSLNYANMMIENCIGIFGLPIGLAINFLIDGYSVLIPMATEEPSIIASCSKIASLVGKSGGFQTKVDKSHMIGQIQLNTVRNIHQATKTIQQNKINLINLANKLCKNMVNRGGGVKDIYTKILVPNSKKFAKFDNGKPMLIVEFIIDCCDSMGANIVNQVAEGLSKKITKLISSTKGLQILSNLSDKRCASAKCSIPISLLNTNNKNTAHNIIHAFRFAIRDPYRATTHNKGILNGIDAVAIATGNDWRAIEAGAHAFASQSGQYTSLTSYFINHNNHLECKIKLPLAVGITGGIINIHPTVQKNLQILDQFGKSAKKLSGVMAAVGLAQNIGALKALCDNGIQNGHMKLHNRKKKL